MDLFKHLFKHLFKKTVENKEQIATCPNTKCNEPIWVDHYYSWCMNCENPLPENIRNQLPALKKTKHEAARPIPIDAAIADSLVGKRFVSLATLLFAGGIVLIPCMLLLFIRRASTPIPDEGKSSQVKYISEVEKNKRQAYSVFSNFMHVFDKNDYDKLFGAFLSNKKYDIAYASTADIKFDPAISNFKFRGNILVINAGTGPFTAMVDREDSELRLPPHPATTDEVGAIILYSSRDIILTDYNGFMHGSYKGYMACLIDPKNKLWISCILFKGGDGKTPLSQLSDFIMFIEKSCR